MKHKKNILYELFNPSAAVTLCISIPGFTLMELCLAGIITNLALTIIFYLLSAYSLIICLTLIVRNAKKLTGRILKLPAVKKFLETPFGKRFFGNVEYRTKTFLYLGSVINLIFSIANIYSAVFQRSVWCAYLAVYYILLAGMRLMVLRKADKKLNAAEELKIYRSCGIMLLVTNQILTAISIAVVTSGSSFSYRGSMIYAAALFAFYNIITAATNVFKFRKYNRPSLSAAKIINFTAAVVSMFALETAMLSRFSTPADREFSHIMISVSAAAVCTGILIMATYMVIRSTVLLKNAAKTEKGA